MITILHRDRVVYQDPQKLLRNIWMTPLPLLLQLSRSYHNHNLVHFLSTEEICMVKKYNKKYNTGSFKHFAFFGLK